MDYSAITRLNCRSLRLACLALMNAVSAACGNTAVMADTGDAALPGDTAFEAGSDAGVLGEAAIVTQSAVFGRAGATFGYVDIVSTRPDNTILATGMTNDVGRATIQVFSGGSVTAVYRHTTDLGADLVTWVGVKPGDTLIFGRSDLPLTNRRTVQGEQTYSWPVLANATSYRAYTACGVGEASPGTATRTGGVTESSHCHREPMDVLFTAYDRGRLIGHAMRSDVPFRDGTDVAITDWSLPQIATASITGAPSDAYVKGKFYAVIDGFAFSQSSSDYAGQTVNGAFSTTFLWPAFGDRVVGKMSSRLVSGAYLNILDVVAADTLAHIVASPSYPPALDGMLSSGALRRSHWYLTPEGPAGHDGIALKLQWRRSDTVQIGWSFIMPPGQMSIEFPQLPPALDGFGPMAQDSQLFSDIQVFDVPSLSDYDMVRTQPASNILCLECAVRGGHFQRVILTTLTPDL